VGLKSREFGGFGTVSSLTLGGGGIGQVWGSTTREEAIATVKMALDGGINHFDLAPMYGRGEAERVIGLAFSGMGLSDIKFTTKCLLGNVPAADVYDSLNHSLTRSLELMELERIDLFLLHSQLVEEEFFLGLKVEHAQRFMLPLNLFFESVIPAFERLESEGKIGGWGFGLGQPQALDLAMQHNVKPSAVQCVINPLNSAGGMARFLPGFNPNQVLRNCFKHNIPVLGIRALQAGALTSGFDRNLRQDDPDKNDFDRAKSFRALAKDLGESPAILSYRYALSVSGVSSIILGVKNREELAEALEAASKPPLLSEEMAQINQSFAGPL
tara:strand:- start:3147 stop:4130 length:984 start_codon:yes stop_codon:yes gene_type:complete